jgi:hypothetical protein
VPPAGSNRRTSPSSMLPIATASIQIRCLAATYAAMVSCQSRWSSERFNTAAAANRIDGDHCSCALEISTASTSYAGSAVTADTSGSPTLPAATLRSPAACRIDWSMPTVVVLPFVPVTPSQGAAPGDRSRQASSGSPITSTPAATAAATSGWSGRNPGEATTRSAGTGVSASPSRTRAPRSRSRSAAIRSGSPSRSDTTVTSAPRASRTSATAAPVTPSPATTARTPSYRSVMSVTGTRRRTHRDRTPRRAPR